MKKAALLFFTIMVALPCLAEPAEPGLGQQDAKFVQASKEFDWSKTTPLDFLNILKNRKDSIVFIDYAHQPPRDWIKAEHVKQLIEMIGSQESAAPVLSDASPYLPKSPSTVGNEALFLIEGFRKKQYPPTFCSVYDFSPDLKEYKKWWGEWIKTPGPRGGMGAVQVARSGPSLETVLEDSKPLDVPAVDALLLKQDTIRVGAANIKVLVNRLTNVVEYVWASSYGRYVKPKYVMPKVQVLYNRNNL